MSRKRAQRFFTIAAAVPLAAMLGCDAGESGGGVALRKPTALVDRAAAALGPTVNFTLAVGDSGIHRIAYTGTIDIDFGLISRSMADGLIAGSKAASRRVVSKHARNASLHWRVIGEDSSGWTLAARLQDVNFRMDETVDARKELLEQPFTVRLGKQGAMGHFVFRKGYPEDLALAVRGLVEPLQLVVADDGTGTWSAREAQHELNLATRYRRAEVDPATGTTSIVRTVTSASPSPSYATSLAPLGRIAVTVSDAESTFVLAPGGRGVQRVHARQTVTATARQGFVSSHSDDYVAERLPGKLAALPGTVAEANAVLADAVEKTPYVIDARALPQIAGRDVKTIMADYTATLADNTARGHRLLTNYVSYYPERSLELARALDRYAGEKAEEVIGFGFSAMATAGHVEAQRVLVSVTTESGWRALSRERALVAMIDLESPRAETLSAVWALRNAQGDTPEGAIIQSMATNVYGSFGFVQKADPDVTARVVRDLAGLLNGSGALRQQAYALSALSNVGDLETVLPVVAPFFASEDERLRTRAFSAFRRMTGPAAFEAFATRYAAETSAAVRLSALRTLDEMEPSAPRNAWAVSEVSRETDPDAMRVLIRIIGLGLEAHPGNAAVLSSLLDTQTDRDVRRALYAFVSPRAQGGAK
jgi:hypothetical protein